MFPKELLVIGLVVGLCHPITPSHAAPYDGNWSGKRIANARTSNGVVCSPTLMKVTVSNNKVRAILTYNRARLSGRIEPDNTVFFKGRQGRWNYTFSGLVSGSTMQGTWLEEKSGCGGSWAVGTTGFFAKENE